jgi:hypothetical protein
MEDFELSLGMFLLNLRDRLGVAGLLRLYRIMFGLLALICLMLGIGFGSGFALTVFLVLFAVSVGSAALLPYFVPRQPRYVADQVHITRLEVELHIGEIPIHEWTIEAELDEREQLANLSDPFGRPTAAQVAAAMSSFLSTRPQLPPPDLSQSPERQLWSVSCQHDAHLLCAGKENDGLPCQCDCHSPREHFYDVGKQCSVPISRSCSLGNCQQCYAVDGDITCTCGCHRLMAHASPVVGLPTPR